MKRRALIVGSVLASVGAILGVGKASEGFKISHQGNVATTPARDGLYQAMLDHRVPSYMGMSNEFQIKQPGPMAWDAEAVQEAQLAAIREQPWYQAMLRDRVLMNLGTSGYTVQQHLDHPTFTFNNVPADTFHWFKEGDTLTAAAEYPLPLLDQIITDRITLDPEG